MPTRIVTTLVVAAALLAAAVAAWHWPGRQASGPEAATSAGTAAAGKLRKCLRGALIEYTNAPCPAGTREEGVAAGTVTVLPAPPAAPALPGSAARPLLRELAGSADAREMQERIIDRATGR